MNIQDQIKLAFRNSAELKMRMLDDASLPVLGDMAHDIADALRAGGKLLLCGNGGSAADAQHLAAELLVRLRPTHNRAALPAIALAMDLSTITACGNDYSFEEIFSRPLEALGRPGDVLLGITTSARSPNVIRAMKVAKERNIKVHGFLGCSGLPAQDYCDRAFVVPSNVTAHIQECHITAGHILMALVEDLMFEDLKG